MSSDAIAIQTAEAAGQPWVQTLHEWVTTVDHKRLGILYILYALLFLVVAGSEAIDHAHPADVSAQRFCFSAGLQPHVHHAWHDHDFLRGHARAVRLCKLPGAINDRRARHGLSTPECLQFLAHGASADFFFTSVFSAEADSTAQATLPTWAGGRTPL